MLNALLLTSSKDAVVVVVVVVVVVTCKLTNNNKYDTQNADHNFFCKKECLNSVYRLT